MPPANASCKVRVPSAYGSCKAQMPPAKRVRESLLTPDAERFGMGKTPPDEEKKFARGKTPTDAEHFSRGKYDLSDPKTLECPICFKSLFLPVYQCRNGHTACPSCWNNMAMANMSCHSCEEPTGNIRCIVVEKILESLSVRCENAVYGCNEFLRFITRAEHEEVLCKHRPIDCPVPGCCYKGPKLSLLQHFDKVHQMQAVQIDRSRSVEFTMKCTDAYKLLQSDQELYLVHHEAMGSLGDIFYCTSFGPYKKTYQLKVELTSESRYHVLRSAVPEIKRLEDWKLKRDFLLVPNGVQVEPRSNCQYDLELHLFGGVVPTSSVA